ncbi:MAG: DEAD/DEAH box helicase, partial [Lentisphaeria bacterium]|nr:DEAD/DEAH box helicase [Lentisphaeria bacterium]
DFIKNMPFRLVKQENNTLAERPAEVVLGGTLRGEDLALTLRFIYDNMAFLPDGGRLAVDRSGNFFLRQEIMEKELVNSLAMLKVSGSVAGGAFTLSGIENIGMFLADVLPDWLKRCKNLAMEGSLARLANGGNLLNKVVLQCECLENLSERGNYIIKYKWQTNSGSSASWCNIAAAAQNHQRFIKTDNNQLAAVEGFDDINKLNKLVQNLDEENGTFELPRMSIHYYRHLVRRWAGALPACLSESGSNTTFAGDQEVLSGRSFELKAQLRSYQQEGVQWMRSMLINDFNVILADEMGLGKTLQALALFNEMRKYSVNPALVICPASLVENWQRECGKFLNDCKVGLFYGVDRSKVAKAFNDYDLVITSYTMARRESAKLAKVQFNLLILDEAQHIKNPGTANAHSCKAIKALHKVVLTGTPLENSPEDLWSIFDFLHPGLLGSFNSFRKEYANISDSEFLRNDLAARTAPFIKRRVKKDVAPELPPREDIAMFCSMDSVQSELYNQLLAEGRMYLQELAGEKGRNPKGNMQILTTLLRLRQICCHPQLLENDSETPSAKFELLQELLLEHIDSGHKVLLFSQFTSMLKLVQNYLESANISYCYLDGATRNRQEVVDKFNNSPEIPVFLLSLKAGGTGLNLTSADTVIIYDPWWNPATELQAADRTHRIGQTKAVRSIKLLVKDSIEEKILALQERKQEIFDQVVENPALSAEKFSIEDLKFLLG